MDDGSSIKQARATLRHDLICWVLSSAGRAAPLQGVGRGFEPLSTQNKLCLRYCKVGKNVIKSVSMEW
jgi:hypothetical protein